MNKPINPGDEKFPVDVTVRRAPHDDGTVTYTLHVPDADDQEICKVAIDMGVAPEEVGLLGARRNAWGRVSTRQADPARAVELMRHDPHVTR